MLKFKNYILLLFVTTGIFAQAQDFGFIGKKNTISLFSTGGIRVFPLLVGYTGFTSGEPTLKTIKYNSSNQIKEKTTIARYDLRFSYTRLINKKLGIGVEFGYEKFALPMINYDENFEELYGFQSKSKQSTPVFDVFSYMLVFEFHSLKGVAPIGISSSIGIGPKFYSFDHTQNYRYNETMVMDNPYPVGTSDIMAINFFYQLNYKKVLNKFITFDIGLRFHTGIVLPSSNYLLSTSEYSRGYLRDELFTHNLASLISLRTGFSFML